MVKEDGPDIVQMTAQCEQTSSRLIRPDLDLVVITSRYEQGLGLVEVDTSDRSIVLLESVNQCSHAVIPQLDGRGVKRNKDPWSRVVSIHSQSIGGLGMLTAWGERQDPWLSRILIQTAIVSASFCGSDPGSAQHTLVSMVGEVCILASWWKPQLHWTRTCAQRR